MFPKRLQSGDEIRIIAPSRSMAVIKGEQRRLAEERLANLGFNITYGQYVLEHDDFFSTSIEQRVADIHDAFGDPNVKAIIAGIGGYNTNQLLKSIDYSLIKNNPKVFCGYSDITALLAAIHHKTGLITYSGPFFADFGIKYGFEYTLNSFLQAVTTDGMYEIEPADKWSDDPWHLEQDEKQYIASEGYLVLQEGEASGKLIGGNLSTLTSLQGTEYMPSLKDAIIFIEDNEESHPFLFERGLQSLLQQKEANEIKAILIGRFQKESQVTEYFLKKMIESKKEMSGVPIIANIDFGHTNQAATIPFGSYATIKAEKEDVEIFVGE
ncbi:S66 peptidase family protein [Cytobacillus kochii]|uniref:S66 peptidase family protein n=1 Tax=Cytobacillus kochii TaxID=859143 RepID=UPI001CD63801|nr:S66 peptidase family protein [Cytobacillus kochii]MCA1027247.1 LD-carboxypeptidase [Cytobacillus kochii]MCM3320910.1 LD-carboxypeptidase [Cytobacillus kochii]MCM3344257.1 LD-carboxypeptidase [Cytobacillus kochii]